MVWIHFADCESRHYMYIMAQETLVLDRVCLSFLCKMNKSRAWIKGEHA